MITRAQYAAVVEHFLEELSNQLAARSEHLAQHPDVRARIEELATEWRAAEISDGERLRGAAALARLVVDVHRPPFVAEAYADFAALRAHTEAASDPQTGGHAPAL